MILYVIFTSSVCLHFLFLKKGEFFCLCSDGQANFNFKSYPITILMASELNDFPASSTNLSPCLSSKCTQLLIGLLVVFALRQSRYISRSPLSSVISPFSICSTIAIFIYVYPKHTNSKPFVSRNAVSNRIGPLTTLLPPFSARRYHINSNL